jgi:hypothetical protein
MIQKMHGSLFISIALITSALPIAPAQIKSMDRAAKPPENIFAIGESLVYEVSWSNFIVAGELSLQTLGLAKVDGDQAYHVRAQAQSVGVVSFLGYKINDVYESFISTSSLLPIRAEKHSHHGSKREDSSFTIDHQRGVARLDDGHTINVPPDTYDLASLFYAIRLVELKPGRAHTFNLLEDGKLYTVRAEPEAREKVYGRVANYDAFRVSIKLVEAGSTKDPYKLRLFLTNDRRRLPVLITAEPPWGQVRVELSSMSRQPQAPTAQRRKLLMQTVCGQIPLRKVNASIRSGVEYADY